MFIFGYYVSNVWFADAYMMGIFIAKANKGAFRFYTEKLGYVIIVNNGVLKM